MKLEALICQLKQYKFVISCLLFSIYSELTPVLLGPFKKNQITGGPRDLLLLLTTRTHPIQILNSSTTLPTRCFAFKSGEGNPNIRKGGQRDLTGEDGSLADARGADEEDTGPRLQGSLHGLAPNHCTLTPDQKFPGFGFLAAEWEVRRLHARVRESRDEEDSTRR